MLHNLTKNIPNNNETKAKKTGENSLCKTKKKHRERTKQKKTKTQCSKQEKDRKRQTNISKINWESKRRSEPKWVWGVRGREKEKKRNSKNIISKLRKRQWPTEYKLRIYAFGIHLVRECAQMGQYQHNKKKYRILFIETMTQHSSNENTKHKRTLLAHTPAVAKRNECLATSEEQKKEDRRR